MALRAALEYAGMNVHDIDYINVHGTSTPIGDPQEIKAIVDLFGERAFEINISSTKSMPGHLLVAAGAVSAIASIIALELVIIPPSITLFPVYHSFFPLLTLTFTKPHTLDFTPT